MKLQTLNAFKRGSNNEVGIKLSIIRIRSSTVFVPKIDVGLTLHLSQSDLVRDFAYHSAVRIFFHIFKDDIF